MPYLVAHLVFKSLQLEFLRSALFLPETGLLCNTDRVPEEQTCLTDRPSKYRWSTSNVLKGGKSTKTFVEVLGQIILQPGHVVCENTSGLCSPMARSRGLSGSVLLWT